MTTLGKIATELRRPFGQILTLGRRIAAPIARWRHDRRKPGNLRLTQGQIEPRPRVALYLIYQPQGLLGSSPLTLRHLVEKGYAPLVVSNAPLNDADRATIAALSWMVMERPNFGYDFGGYRDGILWLLDQMELPRQLLVLNDSIWFPLWSDDDLLDRLSALDADFFGPIMGDHWRHEWPQLCSFMFGFAGNMLADPRFRQHWERLPVISDKARTVKVCEMQMTMQLAGLGFAPRFLVSIDDHMTALSGLDAEALREVIQYQTQVDPASSPSLQAALGQSDRHAMWQAYLPIFRARHALRYVPLTHPRVLFGALNLGILKKERAARFQTQRAALHAKGMLNRMDPVVQSEILAASNPWAGQMISPEMQPALRAETAQASIPRNLFHIARDAQSIPAALRANLDDLAARNPGWTQKVWYDDAASDWVRATFPGRISDAFHRIAPQYGVCKADFLRYLLIWHFGGVYLDLKSSTDRSLDEIIRPSDHYLLGTWRKPRRWKALQPATGGFEYVQWFLAAGADHPFLKAVIDRLVNNIEGYRPMAYASGAEAVITLTGPIAYTLAIHSLRQDHPHRMVQTEDEGWIYTIFGDEDLHRQLNPGHYGRQTALHVAPPTGPAVLFHLEALIFHLINGFRRVVRPLNHWRLQRRRKHKLAEIDRQTRHHN